MNVSVEAANLHLSMESILAPLSYLSHMLNKDSTVRPWHNDALNDEYRSNRNGIDVYFLADTAIAPIIRRGRRGTAGYALVQIENTRGRLVNAGVTYMNALMLHTEVVFDQSSLARAARAAIPLMAEVGTRTPPTVSRDFVSHIMRGVTRHYARHKEAADAELRNARHSYDTLLRQLDERRAHVVRYSAAAEMYSQTNMDRVRNGKVRLEANKLAVLLNTGIYSTIQFSNDMLTARTNHIDVLWGGNALPMGTYEVRISLHEGILTILPVSLSHSSPDGYPHPHVTASGSVCWGTASTGIRIALTESKWGDALILAHALLQSYSPDNPYIRLQHFDENSTISSSEYARLDRAGNGERGEHSCDDCDDRNSPFCIVECDDNDDSFGPDDCCDYRSATCYTSCSFNGGNVCEEISPCDHCSNDTAYCVTECRYNRDLNRKRPCEECNEQFRNACESCSWNTAVGGFIAHGGSDPRPTARAPEADTSAEGEGADQADSSAGNTDERGVEGDGDLQEQTATGSASRSSSA